MNLESHLPPVLDLCLKSSAIPPAPLGGKHRDRRSPGNGSRLSAMAAVIAAIAASAFAEVKSPPPEAPAPRQVLLDVKFIEVPDNAIDPADFPGNLALKQADVLLKKLIAKKGADILSAPRVTTRSGQRAIIEIGNAPTPPGAGFNFDVTPRIFGNGSEIEVDFTATRTSADEDRRIDGKPVAKTRVVKSNVKLTSGQTCISLSRADAKGRLLLIAVTASIVDAPPPSPKKSAGSDGKALHLGLVPEAGEFEGFINYSLNGSQVRATPNVINAEKSFDWRPVGAEKKEPLPMEINPFGTIYVDSVEWAASVGWVASSVVSADGTANMTGKARRYDAKNREFTTEMTFGRKVTGWVETGKVRAK